MGSLKTFPIIINGFFQRTQRKEFKTMKFSYFVNSTTLRILDFVATPNCFCVSFMDERKVCSFKVDYSDNSVRTLFNTKLYHDTLKNRCDYFISTNAFIRVFKEDDDAYVYTLIKDN